MQPVMYGEVHTMRLGQETRQSLPVREYKGHFFHWVGGVD